MGGAETVPLRFYRALGWRDRLFDLQKIATERFSRSLDPFTRLTARRAAIALGPTPRTERKIRRLGGSDVRSMPQIALPAVDIERLGQLPIREDPQPFRVISMGRMIGWKGLHLGLKAFARFAQRLEHQGRSAQYWH